MLQKLFWTVDGSEVKEELTFEISKYVTIAEATFELSSFQRYHYRHDCWGRCKLVIDSCDFWSYEMFGN